MWVRWSQRNEDNKQRSRESNREMLKSDRRKEWTKATLASNNERVNAYKIEKGCMDCGNKHPAVLQLHHRDGIQKGQRRLNQNRKRTWTFVAMELEKCDVLCANCHLMRHYNEKSGFFAQIKEPNT
jgi:hypothetical protein